MRAKSPFSLKRRTLGASSEPSINVQQTQENRPAPVPSHEKKKAPQGNSHSLSITQDLVDELFNDESEIESLDSPYVETRDEEESGDDDTPKESLSIIPKAFEKKAKRKRFNAKVSEQSSSQDQGFTDLLENKTSKTVVVDMQDVSGDRHQGLKFGRERVNEPTAYNFVKRQPLPSIEPYGW